MLKCLLAIVIMVAFTAELRAQILPYGFANPDLVASFDYEVEIDSRTSSNKGRIAWHLVIWRTETDDIEYSVDVASVERNGPQDVFDGYSTQEIFDIISTSSITASIDSGYAACGSSPTTSGMTLARCVTIGSAGYLAYGTDFVRREYSYTCSARTLVDVDNAGSCGDGSIATSGGGLQ